MSRKYLNDKHCVRCGRWTPCPYLKKNMKLLPMAVHKPKVVDIGCGNGRNSMWLEEQGYNDIVSLDMIGDYGTQTQLGKDKIPVKSSSSSIILANYIFMFLNQKERHQVIQEIKRIAAPGCIIMVELYAAKDSYAKTVDESVKMQEKLFKKLGWKKIRYSKERFIAQKEDMYGN